MPQIADLFVYPLKSSKGIRLQSSPVVSTGLLHDRMFAVIDANHKVITAREKPQLLSITSEIYESELWLNAPGMDTLRLPLAPESGAQVEVELFKKPINASMLEGVCNEWISELLGQNCQLSHKPDHIREVIKKNDPSVRGEVGYADSSPILLTSEASLQELNSRLQTPISMDRFRPNIVVKDCELFEEDRWDRLLINDCELVVNKQCKRCVLTTIDPDTFQKDPTREPLKTLATYRNLDGGVTFGIYLIPLTSGKVAVGDEVRIG